MSAAALAQNILILAQEKGLGTFWMIDPKRVKNEINAFLGIKDKELAACIPIGYPDLCLLLFPTTKTCDIKILMSVPRAEISNIHQSAKILF